MEQPPKKFFRLGPDLMVRLKHAYIVKCDSFKTDEHGNVVGENDAYEQSRYIFKKIEKVLAHAGASMKDVVRVRMFVTDISRWEEYGKAHAEYFMDIRPCNTMVEVSKLISPEYLVEIEVSAVVD